MMGRTAACGNALAVVFCVLLGFLVLLADVGRLAPGAGRFTP